MAKPSALCFALLTLFLSLHLTASADPPAAQPPTPDAADTPGSPPPPPIHPPTPPPSDISSPPAPPPDSSTPSPSTPPSPSSSPSPSSTPSPSDPDADAPPPSPPSPPPPPATVSKSSGLTAGTKAGVALGVFAFVGLAALGAFVYKKRKDNVERARYGSAARRDML